VNAEDDIMENYYDELASLIYGPNWRANPGRNHFMGLTTIQQAKFSSLVSSITNKNGATATSSDLWKFTDIICNELHFRVVGKLCVIFKRMPRLMIPIGILVVVLFALSFILPAVF